MRAFENPRRILIVGALVGAFLFGVIITLVLRNAHKVEYVTSPQPAESPSPAPTVTQPSARPAEPATSAAVVPQTTTPLVTQAPTTAASQPQRITSFPMSDDHHWDEACAHRHPRHPFAYEIKRGMLHFDPYEPKAYRMKCYDALGHIAPPVPSVAYSGVSVEEYCRLYGLHAREPGDIWAPNALAGWWCVSS